MITEENFGVQIFRNFTVLAGVVVVVFFGYRYWYSDDIVPGFSLTKTGVKSEGDTKLKQDMADSRKGADGVKEGDLKITVEGKVGAVDFVKIGISGVDQEFLVRGFKFAKWGSI